MAALSNRLLDYVDQRQRGDPLQVHPDAICVEGIHITRYIADFLVNRSADVPYQGNAKKKVWEFRKVCREPGELPTAWRTSKPKSLNYEFPEIIFTCGNVGRVLISMGYGFEIPNRPNLVQKHK